MERLVPTGKKAVDGQRVLFKGVESGLVWDLPPNYKSPKFEFVGRAKRDRRRVLVRDEQGMVADVTPARARRLLTL